MCPTEAEMNGSDNFDLLLGPALDSAANSSRVFTRHFDSSSSSSPAFSDPDDDDDHRFSTTSLESTTKRLDHTLQFLDRNLASPAAPPGYCDLNVRTDGSLTPALPEFISSGGGAGMFKLPVRAAVHPGRPPSLELRPHPLRETESGCFLRTLVATRTQLWAGGERSLRVWDLSRDLYATAAREGTDAAELDTAPFRESLDGISPTVCMVADEGSRVVWTGHKDGKIRCWKMLSSETDQFNESLAWQAHRGPVLAIAISSHGDIWSGSEGGVIRIWPWETIEKSLSYTAEERHLAASSIDRSYIDPSNQVSTSGFNNCLAADVKHFLSDNARGRMWSASYLTFAQWDARTKELIRVFNVDGPVDIRAEAIYQDFSTEYGSSPKKGVQTSFSFLQRSRNAIMGAAEAVVRVATKGAVDDNRRAEAMTITINGIIWSGCTSGLLIQWDGNGNRLQDFHYHSCPVQCFCPVGLRLWVGYASGTIQVLNLEGKLLGEWVAHSSSVIKLTVGDNYVFSMASHGGIRGWNITSPGPLDSILRSELAGKEFVYTRIENIKVLAGTWNVGQGRASRDSLTSWLGSAASSASIVVVGLQEVDMGAGFLAMSAAKETVGLEGSAVGQWWLDIIGKTLDEGSTFERIGSRQLAGLLIGVWVRNNLRPHAGDVDAAAVPCGFGRAIGNKGAVAIRIRVYDRIICFINCHFAAHVDAVSRRNADFDHVYKTMTFSKPPNLFNGTTVGASSAAQMLRAASAIGNPSDEVRPELSEADMVIFLGDFNYRLDDISYDEARDFVSQRCFDWLREKDQLRSEMEAGNVFQGMREAVINFPPTYKFDRHQIGLSAYDSGEKKRVPAWCDRILYRDSRTSQQTECSLECPVVSSIVEYEGCMDVTDSDHKPVRCIFSVDIARVDEPVRRQELGEIIQSNENVHSVLDQLYDVPDTIVSTNNIILSHQDTSILRITNKSRTKNALFKIICEGVSVIREDGQAPDHQPRGAFGFPPWLEVHPASGIISPDRTVEVTVHPEKFQTVEEFVDGFPSNGRCEDTSDKEVILLIMVGGDYTMTRTRTHRVRVRHSCSSSKEKQTDLVVSGDSQMQKESILHRSNIQRLSDSYDVVEHLRNLHSP